MGAKEVMLRQEWTRLRSPKIENGSFVGNPQTSRSLSQTSYVSAFQITTLCQLPNILKTPISQLHLPTLEWSTPA